MYSASHAFHIHFTALEHKKSKKIKHGGRIHSKEESKLQEPKKRSVVTSGPPVSCNIGKLRKN